MGEIKKRIEYLDALRGFTMILVVVAHVILYSYHGLQSFSWGNFFTLFRMPLFFFISGFIMYKASVEWNGKTTIEFIKKKFRVQILPTIVFLLVFIYVYHLDCNNVVADKYKAGYWFTPTLFAYFFIYSSFSMLCSRLTCLGGGRSDFILLVLSVGFVFLDTKYMSQYHVVNVLSMQQWKFFIFFVIGVLARRFFDKFTKLLCHSWFMTLTIVAFFGSVLLWYEEDSDIWGMKLKFLAWGLLGIIIVFSFFMKKESSFSSKTLGGRTLQYIGKRTLDIYLLHYFFLPRNLQIIGNYFEGNTNPTIELFVSIVISLLVIGLCLLVSHVIRLSPTLAYWFFGQKKE